MRSRERLANRRLNGRLTFRQPTPPRQLPATPAYLHAHTRKRQDNVKNDLPNWFQVAAEQHS